MKNHLYPSPAVLALEIAEQAERPAFVPAIFDKAPKATLPPITVGDDQYIIHVSPGLALFLRVQYAVEPKVEGHYQRSRFIAESIYGVVHPVSAELLAVNAQGWEEDIATFERWSDVPEALRNLEKVGRPDAKTLGWSQIDLWEVHGNDDE